MVYDLTRWFLKEKSEEKEVTLEDVIPLHPNEYPARNLKRRLDARRDEMLEIVDRCHPEGIH